jgi:TRAP-type transport system small permease protein
LKKLLTTLCGVMAACGLFAIMVLTLVDVSGRKLLDSSVPGSLELTEILMVAVIFAALPLVCLRGEHVVFDSLDDVLPPWLRRLQHSVIELLCALLLAGLAWLMWQKAAQLESYGETTAQLKLPLYMMVYVMAVLLWLAALMHAWLLVKPDAGRHQVDGVEGAL